MTIRGATIVVTDAEQRSALATVRSLGRAGCRVVVCATHPRSLAGASRHCARELIVPSPLDSPVEFAAAIALAVKEVDATVLLPVSEASLLALLPLRSDIRAAMPFPEVQQFRRVCDKAAVLAAARPHGIAVPTQITLQSRADAAAFDGKWRFPIVLKPARSVATNAIDDESVRRSKPTRFKTSVSYAADQHALDRLLDALPPAAFPVLAQERITGPGFAISILLWDGKVQAAFAHRRLREKPPSGGVSVLREGIPLDNALLQRSVELLADFDWRGVAMVEYKLSAETQQPFLMEINGRLWGSLQLAIDSGVDFPRLLVECALGESPEPVTSYAAGIRTQWEWGDVDHLLARLRRSAEALALPAGAPGRVHTIASFLRSLGPGVRREVLRWDDLGPFLRESADWFRGH